MADKKETVELIIKTMNKYAGLYTKSQNYNTGIDVSFSEMQTLEKIVESENIYQTALANALGVTRGAVSKGIKKLENKGLVTFSKADDNKKNKLLRATDKGKHVYQSYADFVQKELFAKAFEIVEKYENGTAILNELFGAIDSFLGAVPSCE